MIKLSYITGSIFYLFQANPSLPDLTSNSSFDIINKFGVIGAMGLAIWYIIKEKDKLMSEITELRKEIVLIQHQRNDVDVKRMEIDTRLNTTLTLMNEALTELREDFRELKFTSKINNKIN